MPPTKRVDFKPEYKKGGDVIKKYLCSKLDIDEQQAIQYIRTYVTDINSRLKNLERVNIDGVGELSVNISGKIEFNELREENYLADSFGLEPIEIRKEPTPTPAPIPEKRTPVKKPQRLNVSGRSSTLTFVVVGIIVISILMGLTIFISAKFDLYLFNIGDFTGQKDDMIVIGGITSDPTYKALEEEIEKKTSTKNALQYTPGEQSNEATSYNQFLLVAGSFKSYKNADDLKRNLLSDGFSPSIVEAGGHYRVCIGEFSDKQEALTELRRIRQNIDRSVWLLTVNN